MRTGTVTQFGLTQGDWPWVLDELMAQHAACVGSGGASWTHIAMASGDSGSGSGVTTTTGFSGHVSNGAAILSAEQQCARASPSGLCTHSGPDRVGIGGDTWGVRPALPIHVLARRHVVGERPVDCLDDVAGGTGIVEVAEVRRHDEFMPRLFADERSVDGEVADDLAWIERDRAILVNDCRLEHDHAPTVRRLRGSDAGLSGQSIAHRHHEVGRLGSRVTGEEIADGVGLARYAFHLRCVQQDLEHVLPAARLRVAPQEQITAVAADGQQLGSPPAAGRVATRP